MESFESSIHNKMHGNTQLMKPQCFSQIFALIYYPRFNLRSWLRSRVVQYLEYSIKGCFFVSIGNIYTRCFYGCSLFMRWRSSRGASSVFPDIALDLFGYKQHPKGLREKRSALQTKKNVFSGKVSRSNRRRLPRPPPRAGTHYCLERIS